MSSWSSPIGAYSAFTRKVPRFWSSTRTIRARWATSPCGPSPWPTVSTCHPTSATWTTNTPSPSRGHTRCTSWARPVRLTCTTGSPPSDPACTTYKVLRYVRDCSPYPSLNQSFVKQAINLFIRIIRFYLNSNNHTSSNTFQVKIQVQILCFF